MTEQERAEKIVSKMMKDDRFSQWLGLEVRKIVPGFVKLHLTVRPEMVNGFSVTHGGIAFSMADSALAFASNSYGRVALALENNITYFRKVLAGDRLTATTEELHLGKTIGSYSIKVSNQKDQDIAYFKGTVFRTKKLHLKK